MRLLFATDAFPPVSGGSGWSTYELAKGLRARGHEIVVVQPVSESKANREFDGFRIVEFPYSAPGVPFVRNYFKNERLYANFSAFLEPVIRQHRIQLVHAQHRLTGPGSITAARKAGVPGICTIRDYWPLCYWSDLIHDAHSDTSCPACTPSMMTRCVRPHAGAAWPLTLPMIPYMRANLRSKRTALSQAHAIVAVSGAVGQLLRTRERELASSRIEVIPNPVDVEAIRSQAELQPRPRPEPYAIFVGKLEPNKGVTTLIDVIERARLDWPLVIVGDGAQRADIEAAAKRSGQQVQFTGWLSREQVLGWVRHSEFVVFPSRWPEPLSRVLLEASALAVPVAALDTGGTRDVIIDGVTGCLARSATELADAVGRLRRDAALRKTLGASARQHVEKNFQTPVVVERMENLYADLLDAL